MYPSVTPLKITPEQEFSGSLHIAAHAGYNYVEYRNRSLWFVLAAVLVGHPEVAWVRERARRILIAALAGGASDFCEMLPATAALLRSRATNTLRESLADLRTSALARSRTLGHDRGANDSWGLHKRRLAGVLELTMLLAGDRPAAESLLSEIHSLPGGFAGFQAPAYGNPSVNALTRTAP